MMNKEKGIGQSANHAEVVGLIIQLVSSLEGVAVDEIILTPMGVLGRSKEGLGIDRGFGLVRLSALQKFVADTRNPVNIPKRESQGRSHTRNLGAAKAYMKNGRLVLENNDGTLETNIETATATQTKPFLTQEDSPRSVADLLKNYCFPIYASTDSSLRWVEVCDVKLKKRFPLF